MSENQLEAWGATQVSVERVTIRTNRHGAVLAAPIDGIKLSISQAYADGPGGASVGLLIPADKAEAFFRRAMQVAFGNRPSATLQDP